MPPKEKKKKNKEPKVSFYQAIASYKIDLIQNEIKDAERDLDVLSEKNKNLKQRNQRLNATKEYQMNKTFEEYKKFIEDTNSMKKCDKEEVNVFMKDNWRFKQMQEKEILNIRRDIKRTEKDISAAKKELKIWTEFKNKGTHELELQRRLLCKEIDYMHENFEIISNHLKSSLVKTIDKIERNTIETIQKKNKSAAEKAFKELDKKAIIMTHDNEWMKEKIDIYRKELAGIQEVTNRLQEENIQLMNYLHECNNDELDLVKNVFRTQFLDNENLEIDGIMNVDLNQLDTVRGKTDKSNMESTLKRIQELELKENKKNENQFLAIREDEEENDDSVKLGKYEYKTLSLHGYRKPIINPPTPTAEEVKAFNFKGEEWPITQSMLYEALKYQVDQNQ